ncbi:MAG: DUF5565 family protein [Bacteroidota bacterium]
MRKILTIFDRNWDTDRKVNTQLIVDFDFANAVATEKLDGMNIRVTVRNGTVVRSEKRRNPSKEQKQNGIVDPWYVDIDTNTSQDKWLVDAISNTDFSAVPDGEWSGEAIGKNIQGNPLNLSNNQVFLFSLPSWRERIQLEDAPYTHAELVQYLNSRKSAVGEDCLMEGIVWHHPNGDMVKIKRKDFPRD